jgi:hypothetical protein
MNRSWDNIFELEFTGDDLVDVNELSAMVPILDICNHKGGEDWVTLKAEDSMLQIITNCDLLPGEEIFGNYGDKSNEILLYAYGFTIENNSFDSVTLKIGRLGGREGLGESYYLTRGDGISGIPQVNC